MKAIKETVIVGGDSSLNLAVALCLCAPALFAQNNSPAPTRPGPKILDEQVLERHVNEQLTRRITEHTNRQGQTITLTNRIHLLSPGINFRDSSTGEQRPSRPAFQITWTG